MNSDALRKKRARAEWRYRFYGIAGLSVASLALLLLLSVIIFKGAAGLMQTEIRLTVALPQPIQQHADIAWRSLLQDSLQKRFPDASRRKLIHLLSEFADAELEHYVAFHPQEATSGTVSLWLTASDAADRYAKASPASRDSRTDIRLDAQQKQWFETLQKEGFARTVFNTGFFTKGDSRQPEQAGFLSSMAGSFLTLLVCLGVAFPLGVFTAIYLEEFAAKNALVDLIEVNINNLAAVPSIVFGLLGLAIYLNLFGMPRSASLVGGLTLALMILPTIIITTRASIKSVPDSIRNAARALGASPIQVVFHHVVPLAIPGIMTGTILGMARAIGETAPLLLIGMVAFVADVPHRFTDPAAVMPVQIYLWASSPELSFIEKTAAGIMVLLFVLLALNALAIVIRRKYEQRW